MSSICLCFKIHHPYQIRSDYDFFEIGSNHDYSNNEADKSAIERVSAEHYLPACRMLLQQIKKHKAWFRVSFTISGTALDLFECYVPEMIEVLAELVETGCVELINETYYHSLASVYSRDEFLRQSEKHAHKLERLFSYRPTTFCNTDLIYNDNIAQWVEELGRQTIIVDGCDSLMGWRDPNFIHMSKNCYKLHLLPRNCRLSEDISQRFTNEAWDKYPLTVDRYLGWFSDLQHADVVTLYMDLLNFSEQQNKLVDIYRFLNIFILEILDRHEFDFVTPCQTFDKYDPIGKITSNTTHSCGNSSHDLSAWLDNSLQHSSSEQAYAIEDILINTNDAHLIEDWGRLLSSDHMCYLSKKQSSKLSCRNTLSPYKTPYEAYINYLNVLSDIALRASEINAQKCIQDKSSSISLVEVA